MTITIRQLTAGRLSRGRCVKSTAKLRKAKRCTLATTRGTLRRTARAGDNSVAFSGRIGTKALAPGSYEATLAVKGAKRPTARFTVVKPAERRPSAFSGSDHVVVRPKAPPERGFCEERLMGLEPTTFCMASRRSSQLSYSRTAAQYSLGVAGGRGAGGGV